VHGDAQAPGRRLLVEVCDAVGGARLRLGEIRTILQAMRRPNLFRQGAVLGIAPLIDGPAAVPSLRRAVDEDALLEAEDAAPEEVLVAKLAVRSPAHRVQALAVWVGVGT
jgi:hypothetical protein